MAVNLELLKTACYFNNLGETALEDIGRFIFEKRLPMAEFILWEGGKHDSIYFVVTGVIKLFATSAEGREFIVRIVYGGDSLNDDNLFNKDISLLGASAMSPVLLYGLNFDDLKNIMESHASVRSRISEVFAGRHRYLVKLAKELVFKNVTGRLSRLLLERESLVRAGVEYQRITQQDMASMIGTVRELVSRSLKELEGMGAIGIEHNQLIIKDRKQLEALSSV
jgi:CRP/FNR family transcriptional regulator, cyclic AMP receptor protein